MNIQITSRKFRAKDSLKQFIHKELQSLEKYNDEILEANVVLSYTHTKDSIKTAEIIIKIPGKVLSVMETTEEYSKSVNLAVEKLIRQLKKEKTKKIAKVR